MSTAQFSAEDAAGTGALTGSPEPEWTTADLFDDHEDSVDVCDTAFLRFGRRRAFRGRCEGVRTAGDHRVVREVLSQPGEGRVIVVDGGGDPRVGLLGDRLARLGVENGWVGAVVHGAVRDSQVLDELDFGVLAVAVTSRRDLHAAPGLSGLDVHFGGATFRPGAWVYADRDSVLTTAEQLA
jgi:regulator of ribonuclease activity A